MVSPPIDTWLTTLGHASWQGGLALGVVWLVCRLAPAVCARVRCWLWRFAFLKVLVVLFGPASINLPVLPGEKISVPPRSAVVSLAASPTTSIPTGEPAAEPSSPRPTSPSTIPSWPSALFAVWLLGVLVCTFRLLQQWYRLERLRKGCSELRRPDLLAMRAELCCALCLRYEPPLRASEHVERPMLVGIYRPEVILPTQILEGGDSEEQRLVLAHELGHLQRRDLLWGWLPAVVCTLLFFHPLVWLAAAEWHHAHEQACDELTLRTTDASPAEYGQLLLQLSARPARTPFSVLPTASIASSYESLRRRLIALGAPVPEPSPRHRILGSALGVLALLAFVPWRAVASPVTYLDISAVANQKLNEGMGTDKLLDNNLADLPRGERDFAGLRFRVEDRCIQLGSAMLPEGARWADPIPVGRRFSRLAVLHGTMWGGAAPGKLQHVPDGTPIAEYRVHYADGDMQTIPVVYGAHLRDWWVPAEPPVSEAAVAWTGRNGANPDPGIRLYAYTWRNPRPGVEVKYLSYVSLGTGAAPFCVALTVGD